MNDETFLELHFSGGRFEEHEMPLEVLKDLSVLNDIILNIAVKKYMESNPERKRLPKGFRNQNWLALSHLEKGSVIVKLAVVSLACGLFSNYPLCIDAAGDEALKTLKNVETPDQFDPSVTREILSNFAALGQHLQEGEQIDFSRKGAERISYHPEMCKIFRKAAKESYKEDVDLYGTICEYDKEKRNATFLTFSGKRLTFPVTCELSRSVSDAFQKYPKTKVEIEGIQEFDANGIGKDKLTVNSLEILDPLDTSARIEEFRCLKPGWLDGSGMSFDEKNLEWIDNFLASLVYELARPPYLYPIEGENISAEWDVGALKITLEFDLKEKKAIYYSFSQSVDKDEEKEFDLNSEGTKELTELLKGIIV